MSTQNRRQQQLSGTTAEWAANDIVLLYGEIGLDTTQRRFKIGDGTKKWSELSFIEGGGGGGATDSFGTVAVSGQSSIVADQTNEVLTLVAGTHIGITTNAPAGQVTIATSGLGTAATRNTGTGDTNVILGDDVRLTNARTPSAHTTSHKHGGSDEIATATPTVNAIPKAALGLSTLDTGWIPDLSGTYAAAAKGVTNGDSHDHSGGDGASIPDTAITLTDEATQNATTGRHGFLKKLSNSASEFMDGTGNWSTPAGGSASNSFATISCPTGTNPAADSSTDTLNLAVSGSGLIIAGDSSTDTVTLSLSGIPETTLTLTDEVTQNATTARHGFLKKLSNVATQYMDGTGGWSTPGTGNTLAAKTPEDYGAVGDGITNDTVAIQAWFDALNSIDNDNILVYAEAGIEKIYLLRGTVYFPNAIIDWRGSWLWLDCESSGGSQWVPTGYALPIHKGTGPNLFDGACLLPRCVPMSGGNPYPNDTYCRLEWHNLNIMLKRTTNNNTPSYAIRFFTVTNALLSNCWIYTEAGTGVINQNSWDVYYNCKNMTFLNCGMDLKPAGATGGSGGFWIRNFDTTTGHHTENIKIIGGYFKSGSNDECIAVWVPQQGDQAYGNVKHFSITGAFLHSTFSGRCLTIMNHYGTTRPDSVYATHTVANVHMHAESLSADAVVFKIRDMVVNASNVSIVIDAVVGGTTSDRAVLIQNQLEPYGEPIPCNLHNVQVFCGAGTLSTTSKLVAFEGVGPDSSATPVATLSQCGCSATTNNFFLYGAFRIANVSDCDFKNCIIGACVVGKLHNSRVSGGLRNCFDIQHVTQTMEYNGTAQVPLYQENLSYYLDYLFTIKDWTVYINNGTALRPALFNTTVGAVGYKFPTSGLNIKTVIEDVTFILADAVNAFTSTTWTSFSALCDILRARNISIIEKSTPEVLTILDYSVDFDTDPTVTTSRRKPHIAKGATVDASTDSTYIGKVLEYYGAGDYTFTLPNAATMGTTSYGSQIYIFMRGGGTLTIAAASGDTLNKKSGYDAVLTYGRSAVATYYTSGTWLLDGFLRPAQTTYTATNASTVRALGDIAAYSVANADNLKTVANALYTLINDLAYRGVIRL